MLYLNLVLAGGYWVSGEQHQTGASEQLEKGPEAKHCVPMETLGMKTGGGGKAL